MTDNNPEVNSNQETSDIPLYQEPPQYNQVARSDGQYPSDSAPVYTGSSEATAWKEQSFWMERSTWEETRWNERSGWDERSLWPERQALPPRDLPGDKKISS